MLIKTTLSVPIKACKVVYDFIKDSFRCFALSILIKARSHNLSWLIVSHWGPEVWNDQFQFTERSFAAWNTYCHGQHYLQNNSKNVRRTSGRDNFKLHDFKPWSTRGGYNRYIVSGHERCLGPARMKVPMLRFLWSSPKLLV